MTPARIGAPRAGRRRALVVVAISAVLAVSGLAVWTVAQPPPQPQPQPQQARQAAALADLAHLRSVSKVPPVVHAEDGFPVGVRAQVPVRGDTPAERAIDFVRQLPHLYGVAGSGSGIAVGRIVALGGSMGDAVTLQQVYRGIPVFGAELIVPVTGSEAMGSLGRWTPSLAVDTAPGMDQASAELAAVALGEPAAVAGRPRLVIVDPAIFADDAQRLTTLPDGPRLAWEVGLGAPRFESVLIDAHTGAALLRLPRAHDVFVLDVRTMDGELMAQDTNCLYMGRGPDAGDPQEADARAFFQAAYDWYQSSFGLDSYNGLSAPLTALIHVPFVDASGDPMENAQWNPACAAFQFSDARVQQSIVVHEFQHAVTQYRSGLLYFGVPGALNESFSDIMAFLQTGNPDIGIRDVSAPTIGHTDDFLFEPYDPSAGWFPDNGGVHSNSGITNLVAFNIARDPQAPGIGDQRTAKLYFAALALHAPLADYRMHAFAVETAAIWQGLSAEEICTLRGQYRAAGIDPGWPGCEGLDFDRDDDGVVDVADHCPDTPDPLQENADGDAKGDACDNDRDGDGIPQEGPRGTAIDNCPDDVNELQEDADRDGIGAACDPTEDGDLDDDAVADAVDNCQLVYNPRPQPDADRDGNGDACDPDTDGDGITTNDDHCTDVVDPENSDTDGDTLGDACDPCPTTADAGITWTSVTDINAAGEAITDVRPLFADLDGDGLPDSCDRLIDGVNGAEARLADDGGLRAPGQEHPRELVIVGDPGSEVAVSIPACERVCAAPSPRDACVEVAVTERDPGTSVSIRDDLATTVARAAGEEPLRYAPEGGRSYELVFALTGPTRAEDTLVVTASTCSAPTDPGSSPTPAPSTTPVPATAPPPIASGASLTLTVGGEVTVINGGSCKVGAFPGGGFVFAINASERRADGGLDYVGVTVDVAGPDAVDGAYGGRGVLGTVTLGNDGFNIGDLSVTLRDGGTAGEFSGDTRPGNQVVSGTFTC